jgi:hypothetical protein
MNHSACEKWNCEVKHNAKNGFHISHGVDVTKINARFTVSSKISYRKASYNRHCAGQKDSKATNSDHRERLN